MASSLTFSSVSITSNIVTLIGSGFSQINYLNLSLQLQSVLFSIIQLKNTATVVNDTTITADFSGLIVYGDKRLFGDYTVSLNTNDSYCSLLSTGLTLTPSYPSPASLTSIDITTASLSQTLNSVKFMNATTITFTGSGLTGMTNFVVPGFCNVNNFTLVNDTTATLVVLPMIIRNVSTGLLPTTITVYFTIVNNCLLVSPTLCPSATSITCVFTV